MQVLLIETISQQDYVSGMKASTGSVCMTIFSDCSQHLPLNRFLLKAQRLHLRMKLIPQNVSSERSEVAIVTAKIDQCFKAVFMDPARYFRL